MAFTLLFSRFYLKEQIRRADVVGLLLIVTRAAPIVTGQ